METIEKLKVYLDALKGKPITEIGYYNAIISLCDIIRNISDMAVECVELLDNDINENRTCLFGLRMKSIRDTQFQIHTVVDIIDEKMGNDDYLTLENLMFEYERFTKGDNV